MRAALVAGLVAGFAIALPIGAVGAYLVALAARTSLRVGSAAALGVATTDGVYALVAVLGGAALDDVIAPVTTPLRRVSAVVLLAVALHTAVSAVRRHRLDVGETRPRSAPLTARRAYLTLLAMTAANPATVAYFAALVVGGLAHSDMSSGAQAAFVLAAFAASASWQLLLAGGGAALGGLVTGRAGRLGTALLSSIVIAILAVRLA